MFDFQPFLQPDAWEPLMRVPDAPARLRRLVLALAVRGQLVPQNSDDEPARVLVERIQQERAQMVSDGKLRKNEALPPVQEHEKPFEVPSGWEWVRLGEFTQIYRGVTFPASAKTLKSDPEAVACLRTANVQDSLEWDDVLYIPKFYVKNCEQWIEKNDIVISMANSKELVGKVALAKKIPFRSTFGGFLSVIRLMQLEPEYVHLMLRSPEIIAAIRATSSQTVNIANISLGGIRPLPMPVPPLAEQERIVAKVEEVMCLCDELERETKAARETRRAALEAALRALSQSATPHDIEEAWTRIADSWHTLFDAPETVKPLREAVLQLAVQGRLVPQNPQDEPARVLVTRIREEKERLVREKKIKKQDALPPIRDDEKPFDVPASWEWVRLGDVGIINPRNKAEDLTEAAFVPMPLVPIKFGDDANYEKRQWSEIKKGFTHFGNNDVVLAKITPCFQNRKSAVMRNLPNGIGAGTTELHVFRALPDTIDPRFVLIHFKSPQFIETGKSLMTGTAGQQRVPTEHVSVNPFPLPPLAEQKRIVAKVEELLAQCDSLEAQLRHAQETGIATWQALESQLTKGK